MSMIAVSYVRCQNWFDQIALQGIDLTTNAHLKVAHEAKEFSEDPSLEEAADVFISLVGALHQFGYDRFDLARAVEKKMLVNEQRQWAQQPDGTWQHV